jgi:hypothetical protein
MIAFNLKFLHFGKSETTIAEDCNFEVLNPLEIPALPSILKSY